MTRTQPEIDAIILKCKQNAFAQSMTYAIGLRKGVSVFEDSRFQNILINATENPLSTLTQRNLYIDLIVGNGLNISVPSSLGQNNLFTTDF